MVLHLRQQDGVAGPEIGRAPGVGHEVDRLRRAAGPDDLVGAARIEKACHARPGALVGGGGPVAQLVEAAVHVRVVAAVIPFDRLDDRQRLLARRGVVQVDKRPPVHLPIEDREVGPQRLPIDRWRGRRGGRGRCRWRSLGLVQVHWIKGR